jgi:hypothetical protein
MRRQELLISVTWGNREKLLIWVTSYLYTETHNHIVEKEKMEKQEIKDIVDAAIATLKEKDNFLLENDISEWAISHKLAVYLNGKFPHFDVDCEYNGYTKADNNKKYLKILRSRLEELGKLKDSDGDNELLRRSVYPDIIVHKRGEEKNLMVIEVKKVKNYDKDFDREKIVRYTSPDYGNNLNYVLGALVVFKTGNCEISHEIEWYENGQKNISNHRHHSDPVNSAPVIQKPNENEVQ